jgi:hypothetical protein
MKRKMAIIFKEHSLRTTSAASDTLKLVKGLKVGEIARVFHADIKCEVGIGKKKANCSLRQIILRMRQQGWNLDFYHESQNIAIIKRGRHA